MGGTPPFPLYSLLSKGYDVFGAEFGLFYCHVELSGNWSRIRIYFVEYRGSKQIFPIAIVYAQGIKIK